MINLDCKLLKALQMADSGGLGRSLANNSTKEYLMGLEDKPLMDEFVALYIGLGNKKLEQ